MRLTTKTRGALALAITAGLAGGLVVLAAPAASAQTTQSTVASRTVSADATAPSGWSPASRLTLTPTPCEFADNKSNVDFSYKPVEGEFFDSLYIDGVASRGDATLVLDVGSHTYAYSVSNQATGEVQRVEGGTIVIPNCLPTLSLSVASATAGGMVTVSVANLDSNESVEIWLHSTPVLLWSGAAGADGSLSQEVAIPAGTEVASHQIELRRTDSESLFVDLTVTGSGAGTPTGEPGTPTGEPGTPTGETGSSATTPQVPTTNIVRAGATGDVVTPFDWSAPGLVALTALTGLSALAMSRRAARIRAAQLER